MTLEVETVVAVSLMMAVFSAVAAVGTSIVLGAGFERLRSGFEVIRKQTGFFSDAIHKLEQKVEEVDKQAGHFGHAVHQLEAKVGNVGEQANLFSDSMQKLEKKVELVDKQTGFFSDSINRLEKKIDAVDEHGTIVADKIRQHADVDLVSSTKTEALVSQAEDLLTRMASLADAMQATREKAETGERSRIDLGIPKNLTHYVHKQDSENGTHSFH